jgi:hypothetical protein
MTDIVGISAGDASEPVLEMLTRHQIAILQGRLAEGGQQCVTGAIEPEIRGARRPRQGRRQRGAPPRRLAHRRYASRPATRRAAGDHADQNRKPVRTSANPHSPCLGRSRRGDLQEIRRTPPASASDHRGTPPEDVQKRITAGLLARGSLQLSGLPDAGASVTLDDSRSPLTVAGAAPALPHLRRTGFPLSPRCGHLRNHEC